MFLVAPRAQKQILLGYLGPFNRACRRRRWALLPDGCCAEGLVDDVADGLGEPVGGVAHRWAVRRLRLTPAASRVS